MKKYFYHDGTAQQGPFTLEELMTKNLTAETPVWYEGLGEWTTAGKLEELKSLFVHTPPAFHGVDPQPQAESKSQTSVEEVKADPPVEETPATPVVTTAATVTAAVTPTPAATTATGKAPSKSKSSKKSSAWVSYVLGLLVFGGGGYLVYQDMQKNNGVNTTKNSQAVTDSASHSAMQQSTSTKTVAGTDSVKTTTISNPDTAGSSKPATTMSTTNTTAPATTPTTTVTTTKPAVQTTNTKPNTNLKAQQSEAQKAAQKKIDDEKKRQLALQAAAAAKEKDYRNNWPNYISLGDLNYQANDNGISPFDVPVHNSTNAMLDKVTVRVDYIKKDKKTLKSEILTIYNIAPGSTGVANAPEYRRVNNIHVQAFITSVTSRKLHFCFPMNNGNADDPYFCN